MWRFSTGPVEAYLHRRSADLPPAVGVLVSTAATTRPPRTPPLRCKSPRCGRGTLSATTCLKTSWPANAASPRKAAGRGQAGQALPKIVEGRLNGFFKDAEPSEQASVSDNKDRQGPLDVAGVTVTQFVRFEVGQA